MSEIRNIARKTLPRLVVLALIILATSWIYKTYFWKTDLDNEAPMLLDLINEEDTARIIYFGESSNFSYDPVRDSLTDRISDFISYYYPDVPFGTLNHSAYHAGIYLPVIENIDENSAVETVIVTLNMRTLNQDVIHSDLETSMRKMAVMYAPRPPLLNRFLMTLNYYDDKPVYVRDKDMWYDWTYDTLSFDEMDFPYPTIRTWCEVVKFPDSNGVENMEKRGLADHYVKSYAFEIKEDNPMVQDLDRIVKVCKDKDLHLVFNLLAENVQYADSLIGDNLVWLMKRNRDFLVNRYSKMGVPVVDNLTLVPGWDFTDQNWTTEHYGELGRQLIARNVADTLKRWYGDDYQPRPIVVSGK